MGADFYLNPPPPEDPWHKAIDPPSAGRWVLGWWAYLPDWATCHWMVVQYDEGQWWDAYGEVLGDPPSHWRDFPARPKSL